MIGCCVAYYAAQRGFSVTIVDRGGPDTEGCSYGNAGMIVPSHFVPLAAPGMVALGLKWMWNPESPFYIKPRLDWDLMSWGLKFWKAANPAHVARSAPLIRDLSFASRACFEELADLPGMEFGLVKKGLLMLCKTEHALEEEAKGAELANKLGVPAETLDRKATESLDPGVRMDVAGSVYFPKDCHLSPSKFMRALRARLEKLGVQFKWSTEARGWRLNGSRIAALQTANEEMAGDEFVLCGGSWSPEMAKGLRLQLPMQAGKGYSLTLPQPRQLPSICAIFTEARMAITRMGQSLRFGGTMEIAGLNEEVNPVRVRGIIKSVPRYYPDFAAEDFEGIQPWRGLRPCSPDGLPYMGRSRHHENLCIATGHAMMGLSLGPITGKLMGEILAGDKPSIGIELLNPNRYSSL